MSNELGTSAWVLGASRVLRGESEIERERERNQIIRSIYRTTNRPFGIARTFRSAIMDLAELLKFSGGLKRSTG